MKGALADASAPFSFLGLPRVGGGDGRRHVERCLSMAPWRRRLTRKRVRHLPHP